jgi:hypothetical protein
VGCGLLSQQCDEILKHVWDLWIDNHKRPLQEKIDIVEVVDFVWNFLGRKIFSISSISDWLDGEGDGFSESIWTSSKPRSQIGHFLPNASRNT